MAEFGNVREAPQVEGGAFPTVEHFFYSRLLYHIDNELVPLQARFTASQLRISSPGWHWWAPWEDERYTVLTRAREVAANTLRDESWRGQARRHYDAEASQEASDELWDLLVTFFNENEGAWDVCPRSLQTELERLVDLLIAGFEEPEVLPHFFDEANEPTRDLGVHFHRLEWHVVRELRDPRFDPRGEAEDVRAFELVRAFVDVRDCVARVEIGAEVRFHGILYVDPLLTTLRWRQRTLWSWHMVFRILQGRNLEPPIDVDVPESPWERAERRPLDDDCQICGESLIAAPSTDDGPDELVWCVRCGLNYHASCFEPWTVESASRRLPLNCPVCRKRWTDNP